MGLDLSHLRHHLRGDDGRARDLQFVELPPHILQHHAIFGPIGPSLPIAPSATGRSQLRALKSRELTLASIGKGISSGMLYLTY